MLDIKIVLVSLRKELGQIKKMIEVAEAIASNKYETRRKRLTNPTAASPVRDHHSFVPPAQLDPDATLWLN